METITTAALSFAATNLDDLVILTLLFSGTIAPYGKTHIVLGQFLGILALIGASLPGFLGGLVISRRWIGLLGLIPIGMGLFRVFRNREPDAESIPVPGTEADRKVSKRIGTDASGIYAVALITVGNGGDNMGIYTPLFAVLDARGLIVTTGIFLALTAVWCAAGNALSGHPAVTKTAAKYGTMAVPAVLIALGIWILVKNGTFGLFAGP